MEWGAAVAFGAVGGLSNWVSKVENDGDVPGPWIKTRFSRQALLGLPVLWVSITYSTSPSPATTGAPFNTQSFPLADCYLPVWCCRSLISTDHSSELAKTVALLFVEFNSRTPHSQRQRVCARDCGSALSA